MQSAHQTTNDTQRFPTWRTVLFCSLGVILAAQFNTSILTADFKVSAGAICLPVLIYAVKYCPILPVTLLSSAGVLLARAGVAYLADPTAPRLRAGVPGSDLLPRIRPDSPSPSEQGPPVGHSHGAHKPPR